MYTFTHLSVDITYSFDINFLNCLFVFDCYMNLFILGSPF